MFKKWNHGAAPENETMFVLNLGSCLPLSITYMTVKLMQYFFNEVKVTYLRFLYIICELDMQQPYRINRYRNLLLSALNAAKIIY